MGKFNKEKQSFFSFKLTKNTPKKWNLMASDREEGKGMAAAALRGLS